MSSVKVTYFFAQLNDELLRREKLDNGPASIKNTFDLYIANPFTLVEWI